MNSDERDPLAVDMDSLTFLDEPPTALPPDHRPDEELKVMRSYRIPLSLDQWLSEQAKARNTSRSELVRQLIGA